ncbi:MAG: hypothetical protein FWD57_01660 [Polyangiaceae bacterium]|nr:hypothetical protein [Polyangiaceae bacterium]
MDAVLGYVFRFTAYVVIGLSLEMLFSVSGIDRALGYRMERRVPRRYLEGFVSVYMIPLHGFGVLFALEPVAIAIAHWNIVFRYLFYAVCISLAEALWGFVLDKVLGFYTWDYYAKSKYRVFRRGYTLWTLMPMWGAAGLLFEQCSRMMLKLTPHAVEFFHEARLL